MNSFLTIDVWCHLPHFIGITLNNSTVNKKDGYRQRDVRQFLQSAYGTLFGYLTRVTPVCRSAGGIWLR